MSKSKKNKDRRNDNYYYEDSENSSSFNKRKADKWQKSKDRDKKKTQQDLFLD